VRILHFNQYGSHKGGAEGYIADAIAALQKSGHESHLVAFAPDDAGESIAPTTNAPAPDWPSPVDATLDVVSDVIAKFRPDVAYLHAVYHPALIDWIGRRLPSVAYIHGPYPVCPGSAQYLRNSAKVCPHTAGAICLINAQAEKCCWGRDPLKHLRLLRRIAQFRQAHLWMRRIIVGSRFMHDLLVRGGAPASKVACLAPVLIDPGQIREGRDAGSATILYAGRLTSEKGITHLIRALASIDGEWRLLVAGDGPERSSSEALAGQLGIAGRIEFLGWLDVQQLTKRYEQCTVVAFPSLWPEPFGRVGPEAFTHSRPVVAYATGGIPDWLEDGTTGFLIPPGDVGQLGRRLHQLLTQPELCQQMGVQAQHRALSLWTTAQHIEHLLSIFGEAMIQ
jgi:glycosyltransferase involved in cell wall biosynthesis